MVPWLVEGGYAGDVTLADLDRDGDLDIATSNNTEIRVRLGRGDATFDRFTGYAISGLNFRLVVADVDGDGVLDLVAAERDLASLGVFWGNGDGTFQPEMLVATGMAPAGVAATDLDGDGDADLVVACDTGLVVHLATGRNLSAGVPIPLGGPQDAVAFGQVDGDGIADIVSVDSTDDAMFVLRGRGDGTLAAPASVPVDPTYTYGSLGVADLDGDGRDELMLGDSGQSVTFFHNEGTGTFAPGVTYMTLGDVNADFAVGDVTGDGIVDVVVASQGEEITDLFVNRGDGTFDQRELNVGAQPVSVALGDLDGDGRLDLVSTVLVDIAIALGTDAGLDQVVEYPVPTTLYSSLLDDFDGDGELDALGIGVTGSSLWFGAGDGTFEDRRDFPAAQLTFRSSAASGDVDGDGLPDLVGVSADMTQVVVAHNNGDRTFRPPVGYPYLGEPSSVALVDLDHDGRPEIVVAAMLVPTISVFRNNGDGTFAPRVDLTTVSPARDLTAADVDGDGDIDLVFTTAGPDAVTVWLGNGDRTFQPPLDTALSAASKRMLCADFDGDGALDVVVKQTAGTAGTLQMLFGMNSGTFTAGPTSPVPGHIELGTTARVDGPDLDIIGANDTANSLDILDGHGDGTFALPRSYMTGEYPNDVHAADLDHDGVLDFVIGTYTTISVVRARCP
jgi:hypothetical protein